jgi:hypothetical protein
MSTDDLLQIHRTEHEALLQQALTVLQADQRIIAAWLFGSVGRRWLCFVRLPRRWSS